MAGRSTIAALSAALLAGAAATSVTSFPKEKIAALRDTTCTNIEEVKASVGFSDMKKDPYPKVWYDTVIDPDKKCYVVFPSADNRREYRLESLTADEAATRDSANTFLTHHKPCGVCSQLVDLNVYVNKTDLTTPVRKCGLKGFLLQDKIKCLKKLGFTEECARIWNWNVENTGKLHMNGGCMGVCLAHVFAPNNIPHGTDNPCKPFSEGGSDPKHELTSAPASAATAAPASASCAAPDAAAVQPETGKKKGQCGNTINGQPACSAAQWQDGPGRLNPCLQCDECRSGPIFQKVSGRTRRNSGIVSAIARPGEVMEVGHEYVLQQ